MQCLLHVNRPSIITKKSSMLFAVLFILFLTLPTGISAFNPQSVPLASTSSLYWDDGKISKANTNNNDGNDGDNIQKKQLFTRTGCRLQSMFMMGGTATEMLLPLRSPSIVTSAAVVTASVTTSTSSSLKAMLAQSLGGVMFAGALLLYTPIILKLWREKNGDGMSFQTWIFNTMGFTAALLYPLKKGFPISTYVETIALTFQSLLVLGTLSHFKGKLKEFFAALAVYIASFYVLAGPVFPMKYIQWLQLGATISNNYAQVPQIALSFKLKKSSWSIISAGLSTIGNAIRVFTTATLTGDPLILYGHVLGATTNAILATQILMYRDNKELAP